MPEQNHIPLLHNVLFPLQPHLRLLSRRRQTPRRQQIIPPHHFRPYKTFLNVAMNRPRRLHRRRTLSNRPRPHFRFPRREKLYQPEQIIRRADQTVQPRLLQSVGRQQLRRLFLIHLRKFRLQPPANRHHRRIRPPLQRAQFAPLHRRVQLVGFVVPQVQHIQHRPRRQKQKPANRLSLLRRQLRFGQPLLAFTCALHFSSAVFSSRSTGSLFFFKSFSRRSSRRVIWSWSESISSKSRFVASRKGSMLPSECGTEGSSNTRITCAITSTSRNCVSASRMRSFCIPPKST